MTLNLDDDNPKMRINGSLMPQMVGRQKSENESRPSLKLKCTDGHVILVNMLSPVHSLINSNSYVEVTGIPEGRNTLKGYKLFVVPEEMMKDFDAFLYNEMVVRMVANGENNNFYVSDPGSHMRVMNSGVANEMDDFNTF
ncbi:hypothetical protein B4U79_17882 [Dinothrombium tinctorium]|uniref:Uncharacterized protein n=1 Tax=Dinothrombium tinctorium TaxID=1965070 RepID=A0A3S3PNK9_9ACAR|nr:hypothetical protein B4U79_17882 [Dinothrombium tinctorium]